jgi:hypothetical protein
MVHAVREALSIGGGVLIIFTIIALSVASRRQLDRVNAAAAARAERESRRTAPVALRARYVAVTLLGGVEAAVLAYAKGATGQATAFATFPFLVVAWMFAAGGPHRRVPVRIDAGWTPLLRYAAFIAVLGVVVAFLAYTAPEWWD